MTTFPVVWVRLPGKPRRTSGLRLNLFSSVGVEMAEMRATSARVWAAGRVWTLPQDAVSRPRRNGQARIAAERLLGEYRAYLANAAGLRAGLHSRRRAVRA